MVRADDPDPLTFVPMEGVGAADVARAVLSVEDVPPGGLRPAWERLFAADLDDASFDLASGPLWRVKLLR